MGKDERIPTTVRLKPEVRSMWDNIATANNTSTQSVISKALENPNTLQNITINIGTINNNYSSEKKSTSTDDRFVDAHYKESD